MSYSGLDWAADVGGPRIFIAMVHVEGDDFTNLEDDLAAARLRLGRDPNYVFKHVEAKPIVHHHFYSAIANVRSLRAHVYEGDRSTWVLQHERSRRGDPCLCDSIITLTMSCPDELIADQILYIDFPRRELDVVDAFRTALRKSLRRADRRSFKSIKPRPDDRLAGGIVQVADMIAGEVREQGGLHGLYLPLLGSRIKIA